MKRFFRLFGEYIIAFLVAVYLLPMNIRRKSKRRKNTDTLLLMKCDALGDFVMSLDFAKGLRDYFFDKRIIFVCENDFSITQDTNLFDEIIVIDKSVHKSYRSLFKFLSVIKRRKVDLAIHAPSLRSFFKDILFKSINAKEKYLIDTDSVRSGKLKLKISNRWYDYVVEPKAASLMEKEKNADFLRKFGYSDFLSELSVLTDYRSEFNIDYNDYVLVCPTAVNPINKEWPEEGFAEIIKYLNKKNQKVIIAGTADEKKRKQKLFSLLNENDYLDMMGKTNIRQFIALVQQAKLVIGNDSSSIHIAAASKVPSICLLSGFNATRAFPYKIEKCEDENVYYIPHVLYSFPPCNDCAIKNKKKFEKCCNTGRSFDCVSAISVADVKKIIDAIIYTSY